MTGQIFLRRAALAVLVCGGVVGMGCRNPTENRGGTGAVLWRFTPDAQAAEAQSAVDAQAVYVGTRSHKVYALDPTTGQPLWTTDIGADWPYLGVVTGLSVSGDTVYAGAVKRLTVNGDSSVGVIRARSLESRQRRYSRSLPGPSRS